MPERLPLRRRLVFAAIAIALALVFASGVLLAADIYLHRKYERTSVVNVWGYRGPTVGAKAAGEVRIVVLGGSTAFGYGVDWDQAFPYLLQQRLNAEPRRGASSYSVVNLGFNNETSASFVPTLEDFEYLDYDVAILYEGYNDLPAQPRPGTFRRESLVFRTTGYLPILPMILREKYFDWRYGGDIGRGYRAAVDAPTVFRPGDKGAAAAAQALLPSQVGTLSSPGPETARACAPPWLDYCQTVADAVQAARARGALVLVATQPYVSDRHVEQQSALQHALAARFSQDSGVGYANFGRTIDLKDSSLAYDGLHLTAAGNRELAGAFAPAVLRLIESARWREG